MGLAGKRTYKEAFGTEEASQETNWEDTYRQNIQELIDNEAAGLDESAQAEIDSLFPSN